LGGNFASRTRYCGECRRDRLLKPIYKNEVAINGNPTQANAAFSAVFAAALANGGSLDNIAPGISYFKKLHAEGNFVPVKGSAATMESGQTPIVIWWDYLLASEIKPSVPGLKIVIPSNGAYAAYYDQAISKYAPDPAAARLWEEYLYATEGQNLWLEGLCSADRATHPGKQRHRQPGGLQGAAASTFWQCHLPQPGTAVGRGDRGRPAVV
jgi:ABC-type Fe3+ transport system substrate-binding protein